MAIDDNLVLCTMVKEDAFPGGSFDNGKIRWNSVLQALHMSGHDYDRRNVHVCWAHKIKPRLVTANVTAAHRGIVIYQGTSVPKTVCLLLSWDYDTIVNEQNAEENVDNSTMDNVSSEDDSIAQSQKNYSDPSGRDAHGMEVQRPYAGKGMGKIPLKHPRKGPAKAPRPSAKTTDNILFTKYWRDYMVEYSEDMDKEDREAQEEDLQRRLKGLHAAQTLTGDINDDNQEDDDN